SGRPPTIAEGAVCAVATEGTLTRAEAGTARRNSRRRLSTSTILSRPQWTKALGPILKWFGTGAFVVLKRAPAARNDAAAAAYMRDSILRWYRQQRRSRWIGPRPPHRTCAAPEAITSNQCKEGRK